MKFLMIIISAILVNNIVLMQFLGFVLFWEFQKEYPLLWEWVRLSHL